MATWAHHKELADFDKLQEVLSHRGIWVHRPLIVHDRNDTGKKCPCGCDSMFALATETRDHIDILIDPREGTRVVRQNLPEEDRETFDTLASEAKKLTLPRRVSRKQLAAMACTAKVLAIFGGVRGGKTSFNADEIFDQALLHGGFGVQIWWVAPTLEKTEISLRKLIEGEVIGKGRVRRHVAPLIPPELIRYVPSSAKSDRRYIELIDGTRIHLKYASRDGGNLKGDPPLFAILDEGCEVDNKENYHQLLDRLMEADGRLLISTTPVAGHFLKEEVYDAGIDIENWANEKIAWTHITCFENPWVSEQMINDTIEAINDPQRVRREIYGEWVGSGPLLWRHFKEGEHVITTLSYRLPKDLGLMDVTQNVVGSFFLGQSVKRYCGMDFNLHPMSTVEIQVAIHPDDPYQTPILIIPDEVVDKVGTIYEHMDNLERRGYANAGISCDATGAQLNSYRLNHGIKDKNSTQALEMQRRGFACEPCRIGSSGEPSNPAQLERVSLVHRLMMERIQLPSGDLYPRFLIHQRAHKTLISLRVQESDDRGNPAKEPNTVSDRVSGPTDALCYGVYPLEDALFPDGGNGVRLE